MLVEKLRPHQWDERRELIVPGDSTAALIFAVEHFLFLANQAVKKHGAFFVALSGGSTPKALFQKLCASPYKELMPWGRSHFFWSDERSVPPNHPDSNYKMALDAGLATMPIPSSHLHRMHAETDIEANAIAYEEKIKTTLKSHPFDLVMLGMGEDGHTASLFPGTEGLKEQKRLVIANYIPQHNTWRMSFTYRCINEAAHIAIYVFGASKKKRLAEVLCSQSGLYPIEQVGTPSHKALWIADQSAAQELSDKKKTL